VTDSAILDQGTLTGAGRTVIAPEARLQVGSGVGGTLTIDGGHVLAIDAGATAVWGPGPHDIVVEAPSRLENAGELAITNDRVLRGSGTLANTGSLRKLSHGTTSVALAPADGSRLANEGTIDVLAGPRSVERVSTIWQDRARRHGIRRRPDAHGDVQPGRDRLTPRRRGGDHAGGLVGDPDRQPIGRQPRRRARDHAGRIVLGDGASDADAARDPRWLHGPRVRYRERCGQPAEWCRGRGPWLPEHRAVTCGSD
jgi:hypothetical protein